MARNVSATIENNFTKGLITEATGLNFPEDACTDCLNVVFGETGKVYRRPGVDFEIDHQTSLVDRDNAAVSEYEWSGVGGRGELSFVIVQIGSVLHYYSLTSSAFSTSLSSSLSANKKSFTTNLDVFRSVGAPNPQTEHAQFASGNGYLFVTHPYCDPFYVKYDYDNDTIEATKITIEIRDFDGVEDGLRIDERPPTLTNLHGYNLCNQTFFENQTNPYRNINDFRRYAGNFPANRDIWHLYNQPPVGEWGGERFRQAMLGKEGLGNTPAPKGHFILQAFHQDRSAVSGISGIPIVSSSFFRPKATAFFAGRVFYAGVETEDFNSKIYFSQIIENPRQFGKCYQENDPTSRDITDLVDSDGGVIVIPEIATVNKLFSMGSYLLVFAVNGVWAISGSGTEGYGFKATDYSVRKISEVGSLSGLSFISLNGVPAWWAAEGIYVIVPDQTGNLQVQSLTEKSIKTYYRDIDMSAKAYAKGAYDSVEGVAQWLFRRGVDSVSGADSRYNYDEILVFNSETQSFSPWKLSEAPVTLNGVLSLSGLTTGQSTEETVVDNLGNVVVDNNGEEVTAYLTVYSILPSMFKYVITEPITEGSSTYRITYADFEGFTHRDWNSRSYRSDYDSYFITGFKIRGDAQRKFQTNYLTVYTENGAETGSCRLQAVWDYAYSPETSRWSNLQETYKNEENTTVSSRRLKIRGHGKALQFRCISKDNLPFIIHGWSAFETGNGQP